MKHHFTLFSILISVFIFTAGCKLNIQSPPYSISTVSIERGASADGCHNVLGVHFTLVNTADAEIRAVEIYFRLYADKGGEKYVGYPDYIRNQIEERKEVRIRVEESESVCISLDNVVSKAGEDKLLAKPFYIKKIEYENGGIWEDGTGLYRTEIRE